MADVSVVYVGASDAVSVGFDGRTYEAVKGAPVAVPKPLAESLLEQVDTWTLAKAARTAPATPEETKQ